MGVRGGTWGFSQTDGKLTKRIRSIGQLPSLTCFLSDFFEPLYERKQQPMISIPQEKSRATEKMTLDIKKGKRRKKK